MAITANIDPIFTKAGLLTTGVVALTANTAKDAASGTIYTVFDSVQSISSLTSATGVATATTTKAHGLLTGETLLVMGAAQPEYNGQFAITVTSATTFTYAISGAPSSPATGTITCTPINGTRLDSLVFQPIGTNVQTVARVFFNNGGATTTAGNNTYFDDITLPASTLSETASMAGSVMSINVVLPPFWRVLVTLGTTVLAGYAITPVGGTY